VEPSANSVTVSSVISTEKKRALAFIADDIPDSRTDLRTELGGKFLGERTELGGKFLGDVESWLLGISSVNFSSPAMSEANREKGWNDG